MNINNTINLPYKEKGTLYTPYKRLQVHHCYIGFQIKTGLYINHVAVYVSSSVKLPSQGLSINHPSLMTPQLYDEEKGSLHPSKT